VSCSCSSRSSATCWPHVGDTTVVQTYVSCKLDGTGWDDDAQAHLDALADAPSFAERDYQGSNPDAMSAAQQLGSLGVTLTRPTLGADVWEAEGSTFAAADLPAFLAKVEAQPKPPSTEEKVAAAIAAATELGDSTKKALAAALAPPSP